MRMLIGSFVVLLALAVPASADQQFSAVSGKRFSAGEVTIAQGEKLTFRNGDAIVHDVSSTQDDGGKPLFASPLTDPGQESVVEGAQYLSTGEYPFICSVHPDMKATLKVSAEGTPLPRPGTGSPLAVVAPARSLKAIRKSGLRVKLSGPAGQAATIAARAKLSGRTVTLAKATVTIDAAGTQTVTLKLSDKGRSALKRVTKATVTFKLSSGGQTATAKRTFR